jgi:hypothetical protein
MNTMTKAHETSHRNQIALKNNIKFLENHRLLANKTIKNRIDARHFKLQYSGLLELRELMQEFSPTPEELADNFDASLVRVAAIHARNREKEMFLLKYCPVGPVTVEPDEDSLIEPPDDPSITFIVQTSDKEVITVDLIPKEAPKEKPKGRYSSYLETSSMDYAIMSRKQEHKELAEEKAAKDAIDAANYALSESSSSSSSQSQAELDEITPESFDCQSKKPEKITCSIQLVCVSLSNFQGNGSFYNVNYICDPCS